MVLTAHVSSQVRVSKERREGAMNEKEESKERRYLKTAALFPVIKYYVFGPETKNLIKHAIIQNEKPLKQGSKISINLRGNAFEFRVIEAIPDDSYPVDSSKIDIPTSGFTPKVKKWWHH